MKMHWLIGILLLAGGGSEFAQASRSAAITELLTVGWDTRPNSRAEAERLYGQIVEDLPGDRLSLYAYALVKMQQRQMPEAGKLLDQYLAIERQDPNAWRAKAWLSLLTKNAATSLVELDKLSQILADEKVKLGEEERGELIGFLGRMIGFLEGPGEGAVNSSTLAASKKKISERLEGTERTALDAAISGVVDQFGLLATAKDDAEVQEIALKERQKRERLTELATDETAIAARKDELKQAVDKVESEAGAENATYTKADQPLVDQLSALNASAATVDGQLAAVSTDIVALRARLTRERDPVIRGQIIADIDRLSILAGRLDGDLLALARRADGIKAQRTALAVKHAQAQSAFAAKLAIAQREYKGLETKEKRADNERDKLKKPATGNSGKVIALNKQAIALSTYETFPLEAEKQRVLDQLKAK